MAKSPEKFTLPSLGGTLGFGEPLSIFFCTACQKEFCTQELYAAHLPGHTHREALSKMGMGGLQPGGGLHPTLTARFEKLLETVQPRE